MMHDHNYCYLCFCFYCLSNVNDWCQFTWYFHDIFNNQKDEPTKLSNVSSFFDVFYASHINTKKYFTHTYIHTYIHTHTQRINKQREKRVKIHLKKFLGKKSRRGCRQCATRTCCVWCVVCCGAPSVCAQRPHGVLRAAPRGGEGVEGVGAEQRIALRRWRHTRTHTRRGHEGRNCDEGNGGMKWLCALLRQFFVGIIINLYEKCKVNNFMYINDQYIIFIFFLSFFFSSFFSSFFFFCVYVCRHMCNDFVGVINEIKIDTSRFLQFLLNILMMKTFWFISGVDAGDWNVVMSYWMRRTPLSLHAFSDFKLFSRCAIYSFGGKSGLATSALISFTERCCQKNKVE